MEKSLAAISALGLLHKLHFARLPALSALWASPYRGFLWGFPIQSVLHSSDQSERLHSDQSGIKDTTSFYKSQLPSGSENTHFT